MSKVSIIIPVYNVEKYLSKCLDSVVNQTFKDIEIICVNDGSTDSSLQILEKYAQKYNQIKIINQQNAGQGIARNRALKIAQGNFILFLDPDDWIELDTVESCYNCAKINNANVVQFNYKNTDDNGNAISKNNLANFINEKYNYDLNNIGYFKYENINSLYEIDMHIITKFYSRAFLLENNIHFTDGKYGEDWLFSVMTLLKTDKIYYLDKYNYNYRIRKKSSCSSVSKNVMHIFDVFSKIRDFLISNNFYKDLKKQFLLYKIQMIYWAYNYVPENLRFLFDIHCLKWIPLYSYIQIKLKMNNKIINQIKKKIFSVYNQNNHKIFSILSIKIKFNKNTP